MKLIRLGLLLVAILYFLSFALNIKEFSTERGFSSSGYDGSERLGSLYFSLFCGFCYLVLTFGQNYYSKKKSNREAVAASKVAADLTPSDKPPIILPLEINYKWTRNLTKLRARCYFSRSSYRIIAALSLFIFLVGIIGFGFDHRPETHGAYRLAVLFPVLPLIGYGILYRRLSKILPGDLDRQLVARINADSVSVEGGDIVTTLRWASIKRLWKSREVFLLFIDPERPNFITLPVDKLADDAKAFIETKIRESGGKIS